MSSRNLLLGKEADEKGGCVMYLMSRDQRVRDNHALSEAQAEALEHKLPLVVAFNLLPKSRYRRREHYEFMVGGLREVEKNLRAKNVPFVMTSGSMPVEIGKLAHTLKPRTIYCDFSPLTGPRTTQKELAQRVKTRVIVVDTHNIIPAVVLSDHEEFAAHTIRRKIHRAIEQWCVEPDQLKKHPHSFSKKPTGLTWKEVDRIVAKVPKSGINYDFKPGEANAKKSLRNFIDSRLEHYDQRRNDASRDSQSNLSPYLHYGQLSALRIVLELMKHADQPPQIFRSFRMPTHGGGGSAMQSSIDAYVEELVVRKELADNYCFYQPEYLTLKGARDWAQKTLQKHAKDPRETLYTESQLEHGKTHDSLWNAAQVQLTTCGKIHGYMRMYWAKKLLEWTKSPSEALRIALKFNDTYHLDGGDPNGYVGIMWSIAGVHDRPWFERDIFGSIRYMSAGGVRKKFDTDAYIQQWLQSSALSQQK